MDFSGYLVWRRSKSNCRAPESPQASHTAVLTSVSVGCLTPSDPTSFKAKAKRSAMKTWHIF
jgi:hypothetical protein